MVIYRSLTNLSSFQKRIKYSNFPNFVKTIVAHFTPSYCNTEYYMERDPPAKLDGRISLNDGVGKQAAFPKFGGTGASRLTKVMSKPP
jgi:hypothetical protein